VLQAILLSKKKPLKFLEGIFPKALK
jgi:hypothetical protein